MPPTDCPSGDDLAAFDRGDLPPAGIDRVAAHLDGCPACEAALDALSRRAGDAAAASVRRAGSGPAAPAEGRAGTVIAGQYKLVEPLGEGGMGAVWMALQTEPVRRPVAVKLIKAGMDSKAVLARFEAERQALALMDHPNIARVLDAGATDQGRPFFVMELVKGVPVTRYCDDHKLTPRDRLALFLPVCWAVQHAHQKGVIHRDLKPSNILVARYDDRPVPKVIDFGVAKAAGQPLTDRTLLTGFGAVVGTPEYMSPEQATFNALDVDTRSDVYSLGVLLYELLTGTTPLGRDGAGRGGLLDVLRAVRETDPDRPSAKLSTAAGLPAIAAARGTEPNKLAGLVRGELDWIVMKALEKDRTRRYPTANGLALDVERYLTGEPVQAVPPSAGYRARKFARRNRGAVVAAAVVLFALVAGVIGTTVGLVRADAARREAERARERAEAERIGASALARFVYYDILRQADPREQAEWRGVVDPDLTVREALDRAVEMVGRRDGLTPRGEGMVLWAIGDAMVGVGEPEKAIPHLERAQRVMDADPFFGPDHPETVFGMHKLSEALRAAGRPADALALSRRAEALALGRHRPDPGGYAGPLLAMRDVGLAHLAAGDGAAAARKFEAALAWGADRFDPADTRVERLAAHLAEAYRVTGRPADARRLLGGLIARAEAGPDDLWTAHCRAALGRVLVGTGDGAAAEPPLRAALAARRRREPKGWTTAETAALLGRALALQGRAADAEPPLLDGCEGLRAAEAKIPAPHRPRAAEAAGWLADLYDAVGNRAEAARWRPAGKPY